MSSIQRQYASRGTVIRSAITPKLFTITLGGNTSFVLTTYSNGILGLNGIDSAMITAATAVGQTTISASVKQGGQHNITGLSQEFLEFIGRVLYGNQFFINSPVVKVAGVAQQVQLSTYSLDTICTSVTNGTSFYSDGYPVTYILTQPLILQFINPSGAFQTVEILNALEGCCGGGGGGGGGITSINSQTGPAVTFTGSGGITISTPAPNVIDISGGGGGGGGECPLDCQPPLDYTYPLNPQYAINIENWNNTAGPNMFGIRMDDIKTNGFEANGIRMTQIITSLGAIAEGLKIDGVRTGVPGSGSCNGINVSGVGVNANTDPEAQSSIGLNVDNVGGVGSSGSAIGIKTSSVNTIGNAPATGVDISNITGGVTNGIDVKNIKTNNQTSTGIAVLNVKGGGEGGFVQGLTITNIDGGGVGTTAKANAYGINMNNITCGAAAATDAVGMYMETVKADQAPTQTARGIWMKNVGSAAGGRGVALDMSNISAGSEGTGIKIDFVAASSGPATGITMQTVSSSSQSATGVYVRDITRGASGLVTDFAAGVRVEGVVTDPANTVFSPAYGALLSRIGTGANIKPVGAAGQLMRLLDGNLGLAVQTVDASNADVQGDAGNLIFIADNAPAAPANINLVQPNGGWQVGHWFLFSKQTVGNAYQLDDTGANTFNGAAGPFPIPVATGMCIIFWVGGAIGWSAYAF